MAFCHIYIHTYHTYTHIVIYDICIAIVLLAIYNVFPNYNSIFLLNIGLICTMYYPFFRCYIQSERPELYAIVTQLINLTTMKSDKHTWQRGVIAQW